MNHNVSLLHIWRKVHLTSIACILEKEEIKDQKQKDSSQIDPKLTRYFRTLGINNIEH